MGKYSDMTSSKPVENKPSLTTQCCHHNCILTATAGRECVHHYGSGKNNSTRITQAIMNNRDFIKAYRKFCLMDQEDWEKPEIRNWLINNPQCPMGEDEPHSMFVVRYHHWLVDHIKSEAGIATGGDA